MDKSAGEEGYYAESAGEEGHYANLGCFYGTASADDRTAGGAG